MKLKKAIVHLEELRDGLDLPLMAEEEAALNLSIKALELIAEQPPHGYTCIPRPLPGETNEEKEDWGSTLLAGWPCCACDEMIMDDPDASVVLVDKLATWEYPSWGNVLEGSGGRASASLCGRCTNEERPPKYAIRNEGEVHIRVPLDELEDLEGERE